MKVLFTVAAIAWGTQQAPLRGQSPGDAARDYALGRTVGECLTARCQVFSGLLLTEAPVSGEPVKVKIVEQLFGPPVRLEIIEVPYADPNDVRRSGISPNRAWRGGVVFSKNAPVMVVLALERIADAQPGEPVPVATDGHRSAIIRSTT